MLASLVGSSPGVCPSEMEHKGQVASLARAYPWPWAVVLQTGHSKDECCWAKEHTTVGCMTATSMTLEVKVAALNTVLVLDSTCIGP